MCTLVTLSHVLNLKKYTNEFMLCPLIFHFRKSFIRLLWRIVVSKAFAFSYFIVLWDGLFCTLRKEFGWLSAGFPKDTLAKRCAKLRSSVYACPTCIFCVKLKRSIFFRPGKVLQSWMVIHEHYHDEWICLFVFLVVEFNTYLTMVMGRQQKFHLQAMTPVWKEKKEVGKWSVDSAKVLHLLAYRCDGELYARISSTPKKANRCTEGAGWEIVVQLLTWRWERLLTWQSAAVTWQSATTLLASPFLAPGSVSTA